MRSHTLNTLPVAGEKVAPIRVLIVDDSALMRKIISQIVAAQPDMEVVGTAPNGEEALQRAVALRPDVITLDVEMPKMNGVTFLEILMRQQPTRVVMLSSVTTAGAEVTLECLKLGAVDFVAKPSGSISLDLASHGEEIAQKIRVAAGARLRLGRVTRLPVSPSPLKSVSLQATSAPTTVVAIASSTGGPGALHELFSQLPGDLDVGYILVQHLPAGFTEMFAKRLEHDSALRVREAQKGDRIERGLALIAPGGKHLVLDSHGAVAFTEDPPLWGVRPAADVMMRSVSERFGACVLGVILTGMGRDGALGAKAIHAAGGTNLAQDEATSVIFGMPRAAWETKCVESLVPLQDLASQIAQRVMKRSLEASRSPLLKAVGF